MRAWPRGLGVDAARPRREDVETDGQVKAGGRLPQGVVVGVVVVLVDGVAGHHHADHAHLLGLGEVRNGAVDGQDRGLGEAEDAVRRLAAHGLEPAVVRLHAGVLVDGVAVHEQAHADGGIDQLGGEPVLVHVRETFLAAIGTDAHVGELHFLRPGEALLGTKSGTVDEAQRNRFPHSGDDERLGSVVLFDDTRRVVPILWIDVVHVAVGRLADVPVSGDHARRNHRYPLVPR